jgi:hypothetical protein
LSPPVRDLKGAAEYHFNVILEKESATRRGLPAQTAVKLKQTVDMTIFLPRGSNPTLVHDPH